MFAPWRHRFALVTVGATLLLIFVGGLVTSTGSALAVPDWPLSYGMLMPPMVGGIVFEHGHRMVAAIVGLLTLLLAFWTSFSEARRGVRRLAWAALATVVAQGLLGGLTVLFLLPTAVSVAHACLAQTFFGLMIALAYATSREWIDAGAPAPDLTHVRRTALAATGIVWAQLLVGAIMRHSGAGLAIPDFPLAFGRLAPPSWSAAIAIHFTHRLGALAVLAALALLLAAARRSGVRRLRGTATLALLLGVLQGGLGAATVLSGKAVLPTTAHVATGAAILGLCWFTALRALRHLRRAPAPARAAAIARAPEAA
jgi:cytochrome c oxidase assembly protein subunit 15